MSGAPDSLHVVLVAYHFPPAPTVGAFRAAKVARALREAGHRVTVLTASLPGEAGGCRVDERAYVVEALGAWPSPRHALAALKRRVRGAPTSSPAAENAQAGGVPHEVVHATPGWKRLIGSFLWLPDDAQGFIPPASRRAQALVRAGADLLYTTAPPFSDHLVGLRVKRRTGVRWVAEFRDPWIDNPDKPEHTRSAPADRVNAWLERRCLRRADQVVAVSEATRALLAAKLPPGQARKVVLALNGIDEIAPAAADGGTRRPFRIVHAGSLYQDRDPRPFLEGLAAVVRDRRLGPDDVQVDFVGDCRFFRGISVEAFAREAGLGGIVRFTDWLPQPEARAMIARADLLLLLFQNSRFQIANKMYDYLGARRPILAFVDADGEVTRMLRRVGGHHIVTTADPAAARRALNAALDHATAAAWQTDDAVLHEWTTAAQMRCLLHALQLPLTPAG